MRANTEDADARTPAQVKSEEWRSFLFLTVVMVPVLTVLIISGYGFAVWMFQVVAGPPGAP